MLRVTNVGISAMGFVTISLETKLYRESSKPCDRENSTLLNNFFQLHGLIAKKRVQLKPETTITFSFTFDISLLVISCMHRITHHFQFMFTICDVVKFEFSLSLCRSKIKRLSDFDSYKPEPQGLRYLYACYRITWWQDHHSYHGGSKKLVNP